MDCSVGEDEDVARTEVGSFPAARESEEEYCACSVEMRRRSAAYAQFAQWR